MDSLAHLPDGAAAFAANAAFAAKAVFAAFAAKLKGKRQLLHVPRILHRLSLCPGCDIFYLRPVHQKFTASAPRTLEEIGKLSDADSLRQAYFDFGVVTPPKSHGFQASGNPDGRPAREKETDPEAELAEARKLATYAKNKLCQDLSEFCDLGRHALLDKDDLAALEIVLRSTLDQVQSARKSAQDRPSNLDSLPVADVFAGNGEGLPSIPFPAV